MGWGWNAAGKVIGASARTGNRVGTRIGDDLAMRATLRSASRGARRGYLAPGDSTPPPTATTDYLDYRGTATWREAANLDKGQFPLGAFVDIKSRRHRGQIGVPGTLINRHAVVVGPAGSGKTLSILIPWMHAALASNWSVVAVDVKGTLQEEFLDYKDAHGNGALGARLTKWDFTDPRGSSPWEWIAELTSDARVDAAVTALLGRRPEQSTADPYYYQRDYRTLRGLLRFCQAVLPAVRTASDLIRTLEDDATLEPLVQQHSGSPGATDLHAVLRHPPAEYPKVISGVVTALSVLDAAGVNAVTRSTAARRGMDLEGMLDDHHLLIVGAPLEGGQISHALSSLLLNQLRQRLFERFGGDRRPVLLVIDEAPQIIERVDVPQLMEVARSAGVGVVVAMQDVAQIKDENERSSVLSNAAVFASLPGASPKSVHELGQRLGQRYEQTFSLNVAGARGFGNAQQTYGTESVPVLGAREIAHPPFGERPAVLHVKAGELDVTSKPIIVDLAHGLAKGR